MTTAYYRFRQQDGSLSGLFRIRRDDEGLHPEFLSRAGAWTLNPGLLKFQIDPDPDTDVVEVTAKEATSVASSLGASL